MSLMNDQCNKVCRIIDDVLANRPTERDSLIVAVRKAFESLEQFGNSEQLPSVQPRKKGKWILDPDGMDWNLPAWRCSLCGCKNNNIGVVAKGEGLGQNPLMWAGSKYCPNCGADMRGEQNDTD